MQRVGSSIVDTFMTSSFFFGFHILLHIVHTGISSSVNQTNSDIYFTTGADYNDFYQILWCAIWCSGNIC